MVPCPTHIQPDSGCGYWELSRMPQQHRTTAPPTPTTHTPSTGPCSGGGGGYPTGPSGGGGGGGTYRELPALPAQTPSSGGSATPVGSTRGREAEPGASAAYAAAAVLRESHSVGGMAASGRYRTSIGGYKSIIASKDTCFQDAAGFGGFQQGGMLWGRTPDGPHGDLQSPRT